MHNFTPLPALVGGVLIGSATSALLILNGRIAGVSNILAAVVAPRPGDLGWRFAFLAGLLVGGVGLALVAPEGMESTLGRPPAVIALAGVLVGFGTRLGGGCTSGHGVCGISRLSVRSIVATITFIAVGVATVAAYPLLIVAGP